jgi:Leucine-rich repeat (LRR) protein
MKQTIKTLTGKLTSILVLSILIMSCSSDSTSGLEDDDGDDPDEPVVVNIPDQRLLTQIQIALDIDDETDITPEMMLELIELDLNASDDFSGDLSEISDLTGLEYALNLEYFRISYTAVTDLSPVSDLENIEYFRINNTAIDDISPIAGYTNLTYFNANTVTGLTDISPLLGNDNLHTTILREVPMGNEGLETLRTFPIIHRINMRDTGVTDISPLGEMMANGALLNSTPGAEEINGGAVLDFRGLSIEDWSPIAPYVDQINDISGMPANDVVNFPDSNLEDFIKAQLGVDSVESLTTLYLTGLDTLNISGILPIADLTGIENAPNIRYLRFGETSVTDLTPIQGLEKVEYLRFNNTDVTDISPIADYTTLTYFNANTVTGLSDISPLAGNDGLQEAILRNVPFGNEGMSTLRNITSLYRINMRNTGVTDISVLGEMMADGALLNSTPGADEAGGATLDLRELDVDDWSPIEPYLDQISNLDGYPN